MSSPPKVIELKKGRDGVYAPTSEARPPLPKVIKKSPPKVVVHVRRRAKPPLYELHELLRGFQAVGGVVVKALKEFR